jgi:hypothetical protein
MRNLRTSGLALFAVFATSAIAAPAGSANQFHSAAVNTTWTPQANVVQKFLYQAGGKTAECGIIGGSAVTNAKTVSELTFNPTYASCSVNGVAFSQAQVSMNGCDYLLTIEAAANEGPVHLKCPKGAQITITVKVFGVSVCTYHIAEQTPMGKADYSNSIATRIDVEPTLTGIAGTRQGGAECGAATSNTGTYTGRVEVMGEEIGGGAMAAVQVG